MSDFGAGEFDIVNEGSPAAMAASVEDIKTFLESEGIQLKYAFSETGNVEEDQYSYFAIYVNDVVVGAIALADIDITGIAVDLSKSTGGAAFSNAGISQPTFVKANGIISVNYRFLAAQWELGDSYKLTVSGIEVTIGAATMAVPGHSWVASITEQVNIGVAVDSMVVDLAAIIEKNFQSNDPSTRIAALAFSDIAGDKDFPDVVFPAVFVPATATIKKAYLIVRSRDMKDSSGAANKINAAAKTIRVKLSGGAWGTDDIVAMTIANNDWSIDANARGSGIFIIGTLDIKTIIPTPADINGATINVRSEETNASEGITVTDADLTLYGVDSIIVVEWFL